MDGRDAEAADKPVCQTADPRPRCPAMPMPAGACDTHLHIFGPAARYPYTPDRSYTPPNAPLSQYEALADTLGIERAVIVQPSVYGTDNRCTLDAVRDMRLDARAVVVIAADTPDDELERMDAAGARGVRINLSYRGGVGIDAAEQLASRISGLGWHLQLLVDISQFADLDRLVDRCDIPLVFDHMGHLPTARGVNDRGFQTLLGLLREGRAWVKLSGSYRLTGEVSPPYRDVLPFARALVDANPDRCVWATDWPHSAVAIPMPNDGDLADMLIDWVPDPDLRRRILVDNPARLYGFPPVDS